MTSTRKIGTVAAIGALTASVALLSGLGNARADELSQLQANQQILQQEINQIALLKTAPVPPGSPSLAGSFPRSFLIPGTNTSLAIGGYVKLDAFYWLSGGQVNGNATASDGVNNYVNNAPLNLHGTGLLKAPIFNPRSRGNGVFQLTARESRFHIETRTPTAWGPADTYIEFDLYGCSAGGLDCSAVNGVTNGILPRLRLAYGTLGPWLAGQDWVPVNDLQAQPEIIDFGGEEGHFGYARAPQIRYTWQGPYGISAVVGLVSATTETFTPNGAVQTDTAAVGAGSVPGFGTPGLAVNPTKSTLPDGNFVLNFAQPWGHVQLHGVVRNLELQDGAYVSKDYVGYGGGFSGNVRPDWFGWPKDGFGFEAFAGSGIGHYANGTVGPSGWDALATNFGGGPAEGNLCSYGAETGGHVSAACALYIRATTVDAYGGQVNYAHYWAPGLRSTVYYGYQGQAVPSQDIGPVQAALVVNRKLWDAGLNLMWSPVAFVNIGLEYDFGHRVTNHNIRGDENLIEGEFQVNF